MPAVTKTDPCIDLMGSSDTRPMVNRTDLQIRHVAEEIADSVHSQWAK